MPTSLRKASGFSGSRVSMLTATTSKSGPPSFACSASSAGISRRHGTHQVAQRLRSTVRPRQSASVLSWPCGVLERQIGHAERRLRQSQRRDLAMRQRRDLSGDINRGLAGRIGRIASQTRQSRIPPPAQPQPHDSAMTPQATNLAAADACNEGSVRQFGHWRHISAAELRRTHHEQQDVGRTLRVGTRPDHGGHQRLDPLRPASLPAGHCREQGACGDARQKRHHHGARCEEDRSRSRHDPVRDREPANSPSSGRSKTSI